MNWLPRVCSVLIVFGLAGGVAQAGQWSLMPGLQLKLGHDNDPALDDSVSDLYQQFLVVDTELRHQDETDFYALQAQVVGERNNREAFYQADQRSLRWQQKIESLTQQFSADITYRVNSVNTTAFETAGQWLADDRRRYVLDSALSFGQSINAKNSLLFSHSYSGLNYESVEDTVLADSVYQLGSLSWQHRASERTSLSLNLGLGSLHSQPTRIQLDQSSRTRVYGLSWQQNLSEISRLQLGAGFRQVDVDYDDPRLMTAPPSRRNSGEQYSVSYSRNVPLGRFSVYAQNALLPGASGELLSQDTLGLQHSTEVGELLSISLSCDVNRQKRADNDGNYREFASVGAGLQRRWTRTSGFSAQLLYRSQRFAPSGGLFEGNRVELGWWWRPDTLVW